MASPAAPGGQDSSAASFLGALISLTSHSNIRYQGILSNIDPAHATLSLEKEGRCAALGNPQDEVPKSEKVYDYIVFRAADVVDLRIDDPSPKKPVEPHQTPTKSMAPPASEQVTQPGSMGGFPSMYQPMLHPMYGMPPDPYSYGGFVPPPYMGHPMYPPHGTNFGAPPPHMQGIQPPPFPQVPADPAAAAPQPAAGPGAGPTPTPTVAPVMQTQKSLASMQVNDAKADMAQPPSTDGSAAKPHPAEAAEPKQTQLAANPLQARASPPSAAQASATAAQPVEPPAVADQQDASALSSDFDFEKANARFQKKPMEAEQAGQDAGKLRAIPPPQTQSFYDKKTGFFDNISSEIKERNPGERTRYSAADEKERNILTFGDEAANFRAAPRRGRGRGNRHRGSGGRNRGMNKPEWA